jgi:NADH:ubiquinone oxidoreductase subunit 3 (subunit A)
VLGGEPWALFRFQYYIYALLFVVFDVEAVFLFPWAVVFKSMGMRGFLEMMLFVGILAVGLIVAWRRQALEWE